MSVVVISRNKPKTVHLLSGIVKEPVSIFYLVFQQIRYILDMVVLHGSLCSVLSAKEWSRAFPGNRRKPACPLKRCAVPPLPHVAFYVHSMRRAEHDFA